MSEVGKTLRVVVISVGNRGRRWDLGGPLSEHAALAGRDAECATFDALLDRLDSSQSAWLSVVGEAGISSCPLPVAASV